MAVNYSHWFQFSPNSLFQRLKLLFAPGSTQPASETYDTSTRDAGLVQPCVIELDVGGSDDALRHIRDSLFRHNVNRWATLAMSR